MTIALLAVAEKGIRLPHAMRLIMKTEAFVGAWACQTSIGPKLTKIHGQGELHVFDVDRAHGHDAHTNANFISEIGVLVGPPVLIVVLKERVDESISSFVHLKEKS